MGRVHREGAPQIGETHGIVGVRGRPLVHDGPADEPAESRVPEHARRPVTGAGSQRVRALSQ